MLSFFRYKPPFLEHLSAVALLAKAEALAEADQLYKKTTSHGGWDRWSRRLTHSEPGKRKNLPTQV
jgi:hypothetical protein